MDKRRSRRIIKRIAVNFGRKDLKHTGITSDISENGLFIRTTRYYSPGSILKINISLPNNGSKTFSGKVVRTYKEPPYSSLAKNGVGIEVNTTDDSYIVYLSGIED